MRERVREELPEEDLAEAAPGLRGPERLLEAREVVGLLEHLRGRPVELPEPLDDLRRRLAGGLLA